MKNIVTFLISLCFLNGVSQTISSPNKVCSLTFHLSPTGEPIYQLNYLTKKVIEQSTLGVEIKNKSSLIKGFTLKNTETRQVDESWNPVLGEVKTIRNHYQELKVNLANSEGILLNIIFRLYDDGLGFRYEFPQQPHLNYFELMDEKTQFNLTGDHKAFWIPGDYDSNEYNYNETKVSQIDNTKIDLKNGIDLKSIAGDHVCQSPLMLKSSTGLYINIFEAALQNYPVMHLTVNPITYQLTSTLVPNTVGSKAFLKATCTSPWRTIIVSDKATDILSSHITLNLNEPCKLLDTSWIKPQKIIGIWWEMHIGKGTWNYYENNNTTGTYLVPNHKHSANTENAKRHIDFAAANGFDGVLIEGWNIGWEDWFGNWKEDVFDFVTPYSDFDIKAITDYATQKGVKIVMHHETSGPVSNYERHLDRAFDLMKKYNYTSVKTGYVGKIIPRGEFHDGQTMVNHYLHVVKRAADYHFMVDSHESCRPTGMQRTYPNYVAAEAARGNEFNAWSMGNLPMHETILPFTRLMGGPMDYTPGIFQIKMNYYSPSKTQQVHTTLAKQLALYITMYSPFAMAADLPENYEKHLDAFQFIKDVALDYDDTKVLEAEPGDYVTIARKAKNKNNWFVGAITDENDRKAHIDCSFLDANTSYKARIYKDGEGADWKNNPMEYAIKEMIVTNKTILDIKLAKGGGCAISLMPIAKK